jgi:hypothetical protein
MHAGFNNARPSFAVSPSGGGVDPSAVLTFITAMSVSATSEAQKLHARCFDAPVGDTLLGLRRRGHIGRGN